jgi:hypothetical protein
VARLPVLAGILAVAPSLDLHSAIDITGTVTLSHETRGWDVGGKMLIQIRQDVEGGGADVMTSLYRWLRRDSRTAGHIELSLVPPQAPDAQGGMFEVINALIGDGSGIGSLVFAYAAWRQAHRSDAAVTFERDGVKIRVTDATSEMLEQVIRALSVTTVPPQHDPAAEPGQDAS